MRSRFLLPLLVALVVTAPLSAHERGDVFIDILTHVPDTAQTSYDFWQFSKGVGFAFPVAVPLIFKVVPLSGPGHLLAPSEKQFLFEYDNTVFFWDGATHPFTEPGLGYSEILHDDTVLGEIAPMRSGNFLIAERWADRGRGAKLIEFNQSGRVAEYPFPAAVDVLHDRALGAQHIELLADQCTVLYTNGNDDPTGGRVRRMNICTGQAEPDFAALLPDQYAGAIRQLPNGDVLVANGVVILRYSAAGSLLRTYQQPGGVTHIALTTDGSALYAMGAQDDDAKLLLLDPATLDGNPRSFPLGNPAAQFLYKPLQIDDLVVVGEWRASSAASRGRVRAVRSH